LKRLPFVNICDLTRYVDGSKELDIDGVSIVNLSGTCQQFVRRLLTPNPVARPTAGSARSHPWVAADKQPIDAEESLVYQHCAHVV